MNIKNKITAVLVAVGLVTAGALGATTAASATTMPTKTVSWVITSGSTTDRWAQPQTLFTGTAGSCGTPLLQVDVYKYDTPEHIATVDGLIAKGVLNNQNEDGSVWISNKDVAATAPCVTTVAVPTFAPTPPTCTTDGSLSFLSNPAAQNPNGYEFPGKGYRVYISPAYSGPGTYTLTVQKIGAGFDAAFPGGTKLTGATSQTVTVLPKVAEQSTDASSPCYVKPPVVVPEKPAPVVTVVTTQGQPNCDTHKIEYTTTTTTTDWVYDEPTNAYIKGESVVTTDVNYGSVGKDDCAVVVPPTDEPTTTPTPTETPAPVVRADVPVAPLPVVTPSAIPVKAAPQPATNDNALAYTGSNNGPFAVIAGGGLIFIGIMFYLIRRFRRGESI